MDEYPKWKYHQTERPVIVSDRNGEDALGEGWHDIPIRAQQHEAVRVPMGPQNTGSESQPREQTAGERDMAELPKIHEGSHKRRRL